jgi:hypothetical protein
MPFGNIINVGGSSSGSSVDLALMAALDWSRPLWHCRNGGSGRSHDGERSAVTLCFAFFVQTCAFIRSIAVLCLMCSGEAYSSALGHKYGMRKQRKYSKGKQERLCLSCFDGSLVW